ncbi:UDP-3-O-acyl-N-acetylglucosamine deacetylase [bacterium]|nr:UDP-3-O-acyl-N-acetylglucosamine deacetylase [bacterium]
MATLFQHQATIEHTVTVEGFGYWSGRDIRVQFRPAPANSGIVFYRADIAGSPAIPANVACQTDVPLRTSLGSNNCEVEMVEHIMSALAGMKINNCQVWVSGREMPGLDGSCLDFVQALQSAERVEQDIAVKQLVVNAKIRVENQNGWIEATPASHGQSRLKYSLDFSDEPAIGKQVFEFNPSTQNFATEVAPARTFITHAVAEELKSQGMGSRVTYSDLLVFDEQGPIQNQLRFENECARHKLLDLVGDLSLAGFDIIATIHSCRGGHSLNAQLVRQLLKHAEIKVPKRQAA